METGAGNRTLFVALTMTLSKFRREPIMAAALLRPCTKARCRTVSPVDKDAAFGSCPACRRRMTASPCPALTAYEYGRGRSGVITGVLSRD